MIYFKILFWLFAVLTFVIVVINNFDLIAKRLNLRRKKKSISEASQNVSDDSFAIGVWTIVNGGDDDSIMTADIVKNGEEMVDPFREKFFNNIDKILEGKLTTE
jgi:hypothetical protein